MTTETTETNPTEETQVDTNDDTSDEEVDAQAEESTDESGEDSQSKPDAEDDETEEVEHEGQKYKIPKAIKPLLMFQGDYTRKTQDLAEQRKAVEAEKEAVANQAKAGREYVQELAQVVAIDNALKRFEQVDWQRLDAEDPVQAQALWRQRSQLQEARNNIVGQIQQKEQQRTQQERESALNAQQESAKKLQECYATVSREIKDWSPDLAKRISKHAIELGASDEELSAISKPWMVKALHKAFLADQILKKQAAAKPKPEPQEKPVTRISAAKSGTVKDPDKMSSDEWLKWRNAQLKRR